MKYVLLFMFLFVGCQVGNSGQDWTAKGCHRDDTVCMIECKSPIEGLAKYHFNSKASNTMIWTGTHTTFDFYDINLKTRIKIGSDQLESLKYHCKVSR